MRAIPSGSQTVGPFFRIGLEHLCGGSDPEPSGAVMVKVRGKVFDGNGAPVPDAVLEIWHADSSGRYDSARPDDRRRSPCFTRAATDEDGEFGFSIRRPGSVPCEMEVRQAPHLSVLVFARGLLRHLMTRMYFPDETANETDTALQLVPEERRSTLIARGSGSEPGSLEWNVVLQGEEETVFFAW